MRHPWMLRATGPALALVAAPFAYAEDYLTEAQAGEVLFPGQSLTDAGVTLTEVQRKAIAKASGVRVRSDQVRAFKASGGGWLFFDSVVGKHEHIDIAVALDATGSVAGVEILSYRETYGKEVLDPRWRAQFKGKTTASPLTLDEDIRNLSGATLSSQNITRGVKRLLHTWRLVLQAP